MSVLGSEVAPEGAVVDSWCSFDHVSDRFYFELVWSGPMDQMLVCLQI